MTALPTMELLAPAGNPSAALAAFDAGADAVYCGLRKFNARERSENFTHDELSRIIGYAHKLHRKVYVTFNTLLKESELDEAADEMAFLAECRPDAVIVQNLGAARMMREYFPVLTLHASTQLGIHNSAGLETAKEFGFKRVILERQVTLDELRKMIPDGKPPLEMELFVHGALCCCVSGSCLFSSWMGGWSGNRGKCKQPCRRRYFPEGSGSREPGEFLFSPDDLCSLDLLDDFRKLGICSLKIEGRLRRTDYVEKVVRAYRTVLDAETGRRKEALETARNLLRSAVTRKTSAGFYSQTSMKHLIRLDSFGGSGIPCGIVKKIAAGGFEAEMSSRLHVGDTIRIQSDSDAGDGFNMTVLHLEKGNSSVLKVQNGERCFIRSDKKPASGGLIYRTGEAGTDFTDRIAKLPPPKIPLDFTIRLDRSSLSVRIGGLPQEYSTCFPALSPAHSHPVSAAELRNAFASAASEIFSADKIEASVSGEWFLPAGELKELRRTFWKWAEAQVPRDLHRQAILNAMRRFRDDRRKLAGSARGENFPDCTAVNADDPAQGTAAREIDFANPSDEVILPPFVPEGELSGLKRKIDSLLERGASVFRITSFFQFALFSPEQRSRITLKTMFPFPVCNSQDILVCMEFGASGAQAWIELADGDYENLLRCSVLPLEAYVFGRPEILMTRAHIPAPAGKIRDVRNNGFELKKKDRLCTLYPAETIRIPAPPGFSIFRDCRNTGPNPESTASFNFFRDWA